MQWIPIVLIIALLSSVSSVSSAQEAQIVVVSDKLTLGLPGDEFGTSIAGSGGSVVIGAPGYNGSTSTGDPAASSGYAAVFEANPTGVGYTWATSLYSAYPVSYDQFGSSVAMGTWNGLSGNPRPEALAAVPQDDTTIQYPNAGQVSIHRVNDSTGLWQLRQQLEATPPLGQSYFGSSMELDGDRLVVGAYGYGSNSGAVWVFKRYAQPCSLCWIVDSLSSGDPIPYPDPAPSAGARFGAGVDIADACGRIAVAAPDIDNRRGAVYAYKYDLLGNNTWDPEQVLTSPSPSPGYGQRFGGGGGPYLSGGVSLTCDYLAVSDTLGANKVWVYRTADYAVEAGLGPGLPSVSFTYGASIDLSGERLVVGDPNRPPTGSGSLGAVEYYQRVGVGDWVLVATFIPPDNLGSIDFGREVKILDGNILWIGAPDRGHTGPGEAYFVNLDEWTLATPVPLLAPVGYAALLALLAASGIGFAIKRM